MLEESVKLLLFFKDVLEFNSESTLATRALTDFLATNNFNKGLLKWFIQCWVSCGSLYFWRNWYISCGNLCVRSCFLYCLIILLKSAGSVVISPGLFLTVLIFLYQFSSFSLCLLRGLSILLIFSKMKAFCPWLPLLFFYF